MRVALLAPVATAVPPPGYGGTERVVAHLAAGLLRSGHEVALFASGDSQVAVPLRSHFAQSLGDMDKEAYREAEIRHVLWAYGQAKGFDLVHDHTKAWGTLAAAVAGVPVLTTVHNDFTAERRAQYGRHPQHPLVALSRSHRSRMPDLNWLGVVHNAVQTEGVPVVTRKGPYLLFLGRICREKGTHTAIHVARALDWPLVIAGNVSDQAYFEREVRPRLGRSIRYVGEVTGDKKQTLLARARALIFPVAWPEPFGLVPIEANAVGTPVVATRAGAMPELIEAGTNGYLADTLSGLVAATEMAVSLSPFACRAHVDRHFGIDRMVERYVGIYRELLGGGSRAA